MIEEKDEVIEPEQRANLIGARIIDQPDDPPPKQKEKKKKKKE